MYGESHLDIPTHSVASHAEHVIALRRGIVATGSLIAATQLNPTDPWG